MTSIATENIDSQSKHTHKVLLPVEAEHGRLSGLVQKCHEGPVSDLV